MVSVIEKCARVAKVFYDRHQEEDGDGSDVASSSEGWKAAMLTAAMTIDDTATATKHCVDLNVQTYLSAATVSLEKRRVAGVSDLLWPTFLPLSSSLTVGGFCVHGVKFTSRKNNA